MAYKDYKTMTSGYNQMGSAISWPCNGAAWIEHELCIEPNYFPLEYTLVEKDTHSIGEEVEWTVAITGDAVVLKRKSENVAHLPREIPFSDFSDVVLWGALAFNDAGDVMVGLSLYSEQHDLQVPVCITADTNGLAARWTAWSHALGLTPKVLDGDDDLRDPFQGLNKLANSEALPRRMPANRLERGAWGPTDNVYQLKAHRQTPEAHPPH